MRHRRHCAHPVPQRDGDGATTGCFDVAHCHADRRRVPPILGGRVPVDPDNLHTEGNENNNDCADTVVVTGSGGDGGGGDGGPSPPGIGLIFNGQTANGGSLSINNPLSLELYLANVQGQELFLIYRTPAGTWFFLNSAGSSQPLPADLVQVTPYLASAPAPLTGRQPLFSNLTLSPGEYLVYIGVDFQSDGRLTLLGSAIYGMFSFYIVTVR